MVFHANVSPGGWTIGLLVAAVQRRSLTSSTLSSSSSSSCGYFLRTDNPNAFNWFYFSLYIWIIVAWCKMSGLVCLSELCYSMIISSLSNKRASIWESPFVCNLSVTLWLLSVTISLTLHSQRNLRTLSLMRLVRDGKTPLALHHTSPNWASTSLATPLIVFLLAEGVKVLLN
jgi:hypothetical protein